MEKNSNKIKPLDGFNTFVNMMLGTGPILLPPVVASSGIYLSSLILGVMGLINLVSSEFVIEVTNFTYIISRHFLWLITLLKINSQMSFKTKLLI
jgi:hypothetical protein